MPEDFKTFFCTAFTDKREPYEHQKRLACGEKASHESKVSWLGHGTDCISRLISVPTGLGKTAVVILSWLWNRQVKVASSLAEFHPPSSRPRLLNFNS